MAEAFGNAFLLERGLEEKFIVKSRGITDNFEPENSPASEQGIIVMKTEFGIDTASHRSKIISEEDVESATILIGVTRSHAGILAKSFPFYAHKITHLDRDISDPWHQSVDVYEECAEQMYPLVTSVLSSIVENDRSK